MEKTQQLSDTMLDLIATMVAEKVWRKLQPMMQTTDSDLVSRQDLMEKLQVSEATLWKWERQGKLTRYGSFGRRVYYKMSDVEKALANSKQ